jgi:hypothetical protein
MAAGSEGIVLVPVSRRGLAVVSFWDGGPLRVRRALLELVERPAPLPEEPRD